jgi:hypothetical protein
MSTNAVDPKQILMALLARRGGIMPPGGPPQGGMPSGTPPVMPQQPSAQPQQAPQQQQPQGLPQGAAPQLSPATPRGFEGTFGNRQGIISQIVNAAEKRNHDKKVNEAEMYYNQINSFLAAGDQESAHRLLDDNKVRKILKAGLDYQPLTEEPPPEAIGINKAQSKITQKQNMLQKIQQMVSGRGQQQAPPGRAVIPGPSQAQQQTFAKGQQEIATKQAEAYKYQEEGDKAKAEEAAVGPKADAEKLKFQAEADNARTQAIKAQKELDQSEKESPFKISELQARTHQANALADEAEAHAKYWRNGGKLPGSAVSKLMSSARSDLVGQWKDAQKTKNTFHAAIQKQESTTGSKVFSEVLGWTGDARTGAFEADQKFNGINQALKWFDGEGAQKVQNGEMTPAQALAYAYKLAGMPDSPIPLDPNTSNTGGFAKQPDGTYVEQ